SITPENSESTESNRLVLKATQDKVLALLESCYSNREFDREFARIFYLLEKSLGKLSPVGDGLNKVFCNYASVLIFLNIYRLMKNLIKNNNIFIKFASIVRTGFFFAFKENMRNTP